MRLAFRIMKVSKGAPASWLETEVGLTKYAYVPAPSHALLNWMAVLGAMGGSPADVIAYEPVIEWITGMGYIAYPAEEKAASSTSKA